MFKIWQVIVFLCVLNISTVVFALGQETFGDRPIEISCDWYDGVAEVALSPGLVYVRWVNGGEIFCYKADTNEFNKALQKFAAISSPFRRLVIESGPGIIKSLQGDKEFAFNWKLEVTSGIELSMIIGGFIERKDRIYPSLTLFLDGNDINTEQLDIPAGIDVIISDSFRKDPALFAKVQKLAFWENVQDKWRRFIQSELEKIRNDLNDITINCVEIRSPEISKYFPRHRIFAIETMKHPLPNLFAVSVTGEITDLSKQKLGSIDSEHRVQFISISSFLRKQQIKITDADTAISIVKLSVELLSGPKKIIRLKFDSNYSSVFDSRSYSSCCKEDNWQYNTLKQNGEWLIKTNPVGQPKCREYYKSYRITFDEHDVIQEIWGSNW